jgi:hypothetical protein
MAERGRSGGEYYHRRERKGEIPPYHHAARFSGEEPAGQAYEAAQEAIYTGPPNDLSVFRLIVQQVWHVTVLGQAPSEEIRLQLENILSAGQPTDLPEPILRNLSERRRQRIRRGPWIENH